MKKTLIALTIASMAAGVNAAELYNQNGNTLNLSGRAEAVVSHQDATATRGDFEDQSRVRLNVAGTTQINDALYAVGVWEGEFVTADKSAIDTRYGFAGIGGEFGLVTYGKNDGSLGMITDFTDIMSWHGAGAGQKLSVADRTENNLGYVGNFAALTVKANYRFDDATAGQTSTDGFSIGAKYALGNSGFALGAGMASESSVEQYMLGAGYELNNLYFGALATSKTFDNSNDYFGYELAAQYTLDKTVLTGTYANGEFDNDTDASVDQIALEAAYFFKPNFRGYTSYNFNMVDGQDDELILGLRYDY
ncbi:porin [Vibrio sp. SM6]|uniref:Porin n=1 Tax=Vibrio agarilyticus TaxID=2726741 RepID=A0A7X8TQ76_9VIBR|nr:porin [Vibrio agarilyticus]NLS12735.1 porin [Vibrio agarilyticus]